MTYRGKVAGGVVVLEGNARLPEGTVVQIEPVAPAAEPDEDAVYRLADLAVPTGIPDLATNIDHYLYGHPKADHAGG